MGDKVHADGVKARAPGVKSTLFAGKGEGRMKAYPQDLGDKLDQGGHAFDGYGTPHPAPDQAGKACRLASSPARGEDRTGERQEEGNA